MKYMVKLMKLKFAVVTLIWFFLRNEKISAKDEIEELICSVSGKIKPCFFFFDGVYIVCCVRFIIWAANNHDGNLFLF